MHSVLQEEAPHEGILNIKGIEGTVEGKEFLKPHEISPFRLMCLPFPLLTSIPWFLQVEFFSGQNVFWETDDKPTTGEMKTDNRLEVARMPSAQCSGRQARHPPEGLQRALGFISLRGALGSQRGSR